MAITTMHILIDTLTRACEKVSEAEKNQTITLGERRAVLEEMTKRLTIPALELSDRERIMLATNVEALINRWGASDFVLEQLTQIKDALERMPATPT